MLWLSIAIAADDDLDRISNEDEVALGSRPDEPDSDGDGISDWFELRGLHNPNSPADTDGDGIIDILDPDDDGDGVPTADELDVSCPYDSAEFAYHPPAQDPLPPNGYWRWWCELDSANPYPAELRDTDNGGSPDYIDGNDDNDSRTTLEEGTADDDGDGVPNHIDANDFDGPLADLDGDGISNEDELAAGTNASTADSDGDGVTDDLEWGLDTDGDGLEDPVDDDDDGDGVSTLEEGTRDSDDDGVPDYLDEDSDDDGILDVDETEQDADCDGLVARLDPVHDDGPCAPSEPVEEEPAITEEPEETGCQTAPSSTTWLELLRRR